MAAEHSDEPVVLSISEKEELFLDTKPLVIGDLATTIDKLRRDSPKFSMAMKADEKVSYGRPVGVTLGPDGSLLVADDVGDVIWRVTGAPRG